MKLFISLAAGLLLTACATVAFAQDKNNDPKKNYQEYVEKYGYPGPEHKLLEPLVGNWNAKVKMWLDPNESPTVSDSMVVRKSILDGRFIQEECNGKLMDKPFQGIATIGYDRAKQKFVASWIDTASTALKLSYGTYDEANKTFTFSHEGKCPITDKQVVMRDTLRIVSPDEQQMEVYRQLGDAKEAKTMSITLTRK